MEIGKIKMEIIKTGKNIRAETGETKTRTEREKKRRRIVKTEKRRRRRKKIKTRMIRRSLW